MPVRLANCTKVYGETKAVDNVSFGLDYGECFALLGVSGAGKTTCFKCLTGVVKPDGGDVSINGFDITKESEFKNAR
jgi:ABC-type multidrug transport system ATPase subunit